jgi:hypothetical protein
VTARLPSVAAEATERKLVRRVIRRMVSFVKLMTTVAWLSSGIQRSYSPVVGRNAYAAEGMPSALRGGPNIYPAISGSEMRSRR